MKETRQPAASQVVNVTRRQFLTGAASGVSALIAGDQPFHAKIHDTQSVGSGKVREYWIQADSVPRDTVPSHRDDYLGVPYTEAQTSYQFVGYRAYTPQWREPMTADESIGANDGIPGPVIRGQAGDTILIHFRNADTHYGFPHSIHAHGLRYTPENDGAWNNHAPNVPGSAVFPGQNFTYRFTVPQNAAGAWLYYDYSMPESLIMSKPFRNARSRGLTTEAKPGDPDQQYKPMPSELGLFGLVVIEDPHARAADRENIVLFHDLYADDLGHGFTQDLDCVNGHSFLSNTPAFHAKVGERVRWRVGAMGKEKHVFHIHGHRWLSKGQYTDTLILAPATTATIEYVEDAPGKWLYHCHVTEHMMGGMAGLYVVTE